MPSSTKPNARRKSTRAASAPSSHFKNGTRVRDPYPSRLSKPSSTPDLYWEDGSSLSSPSDTYSDSDTKAESLLELDAFGNADDKRQEEPSDTELDLEGDEIMADIAKTEYLYWRRYCLKIVKKTKMSAEALLLLCQPKIFKAYLRWRKKHSRIKKESAMRSYWKRRMDANILDDICNWLLRLGLDKSQEEKSAMYVQDLYAIFHALWIDDKKALHSLIRIFISLLLVMSAATATRPAAIVALTFKDIKLMKVRSLTDGG
ncbi:hypothetical protein K458DRAFT_474323 [Lentithecium fluviatile CBS 122367]|uniref:Uncharacterized protein n=1 Tax=Lentithecium fluviatile CBS 122367 TaxID=1168545 RepID=A0A6G1JHA9_9PLEO|nr:hypothetical protein K458DRAFT_474323 [Lentithecium fluviatile CBS 122367]